MNSQEEKLIVQIFQNFEKDFEEYKSKKTGRISQYFQMHSVEPEYLKDKKNSQKSKGFGKKTNSQLNGQVVVCYGTQNFYIGEYLNNEKQGFGYHHFVNKLIYKGRYEKGIKVDGIVIDPSDNRIVYEGSWANDYYNGRGILRRKDGAVYQGDFVDSEFHGKG